MEKFKKLIRKSNDLLNEAMVYSNEYKNCSDESLKDLYFSLAQMHLDSYNKVRSMIASYVMKKEKEEPNIATIWLFVKDIQDEYLNEIKKQI